MNNTPDEDWKVVNDLYGECCICGKAIRFRESWIYLFTKKAHIRCNTEAPGQMNKPISDPHE